MLMEQKTQKQMASEDTQEMLCCPILLWTGCSPAAAALAVAHAEGSLPWRQLQLVLIPSQSWNGIKEAALSDAPCPVCQPFVLCPRSAENTRWEPMKAAATASRRSTATLQSVQSSAKSRAPTSAPNPSGSPLPRLKVKPRVCPPFGAKPGRRDCTVMKCLERTKGTARLLKLPDAHQGMKPSGQAA